MKPAGITRRRALHLALASGAAGVAGGARAPLQLYRRTGIAFGTTVSITLETAHAGQAEMAFAAGFAEIRHVENVASLTRPDSAVCRLNRDGVLLAPDRAMLDMLAMAAQMHALTAGAFDISVQPMWQAFDVAARRGCWPNAAQVAAVSALVNGSRINFDANKVSFPQKGMAITLNGLAQGYAADRVATALVDLGIVNAFLDTGEIEAMGTRPDGARWRAAIQHPRDKTASTGVAQVQGCLATSGDYQYFWSQDFARNHIIDPRMGASPSAFSSVSVLAATGLLADALSTALFVAGREKGMEMLAHFGAQAQFIDKAGGIFNTAGFPV